MAEDLKAQFAVDLLGAFNEEAEAAEQLQVATQRIANIRITQLRFGQGMALEPAVLDAQALLASAQRDERQAHCRGAPAQLRQRYLATLL
jgi:hypothetical protein